MNKKLLFNQIELESDKAVFTKSVVGAVLNPDWASKNINYSALMLGELTPKQIREAKEYSELFSLDGTLGLSYQIHNGGINQYFFNNYNRDYSSIEHLSNYLTSTLLPFSNDVFGENHEHTLKTKNVIKALAILDSIIDEHHLDENGDFELEVSEACNDCEGTGEIKLEDEGELIESSCSNCDGEGRVYWNETVSYDFDMSSSRKYRLDNFDLNELFWENLPSVEILVELRCEYLYKSSEITQKNNDIER